MASTNHQYATMKNRNNIAQLLRRKVLTIALMLYNSKHARTHIDIR